MVSVRLIRFWLGVIIPLALIPVATIGGKEAKCAYVMLLMAAFWVTEPIPIPVTALFPVIFFPLFDILSTAQACAPYMSVNRLSIGQRLQDKMIYFSGSFAPNNCEQYDGGHRLFGIKSTNMIFVAGLIMAVAIEHCNLHKRIALKVLLTVGTSTKRLLVGFMMSTAFLSMWISNTATTAMMVPILDAVIYEIRKDKKLNEDKNGEMQIDTVKDSEVNLSLTKMEIATINTNENEYSSTNSLKNENTEETMQILRKGLFLSVAYSANIGGTGTLIGTGPNLVIQGVLNKKYPQSNEITFATWMMYAVPGMLVCLVCAWACIFLMFLRKGSKTETKESSDSVRDVLSRKYNELGPIAFREGAVIFLFVVLILLLFLQDPKFIPGWAPSLATVAIKDATPALATVIFLFLIPSDPRNIGSSPPLLDWKTVQQKVPWGIIILLGGGFSMAQGFEVSKLSEWVKTQLTGLNFLSVDALLVVLSIVTAGLTELTSNVATATAFLPVVADLAVALYVHPLFFMLPVAIACSFAFMLPIATPPNAIVYEASGMKTKDMAIPGFVMNILCCAVSIASVNSIGVLLFNLRSFPPWLSNNALNTTISVTEAVTTTVLSTVT